MDKIFLLVTLQLVGVIIPSVGHGATAAPLPPPSRPVKQAAPVPTAISNDKTIAAPVPPKTTPAYQLYSYYGDRYRDPFIPLTGSYQADQGSDRPPQISTLILKGIVQDAKSRMALLTSGVNSYILRGGRLYDGRNHLMKGISGVIKSSSVIIMGSDRTVRELKVNMAL